MNLSLLFLADAPPQNVVWIGLILAAAVGIMWWSRRRMARQKEENDRSTGAVLNDSPRRPSAAGDAAHRQLQQSLTELLLQLEEMSREINGQIDTRLRAMNLLIQEADQKIRELQRLQGTSAAEAVSAVPRIPAPRSEPRPEVASERYAKVYGLAEKGLSVVEIAREMKLMTGEVELILALRRTATDQRGARP
jgi:TolA-binding protein